jgi:hypothetical protein
MPGNPVVGGAVLRRSAIQSPNFVQSPLTGWAVNADGTAYFASVTVSGEFDGTDFVINSSGAFFYSGTPASGNLLISIAPATGTDSHGNAYLDGVAIYHGTADFQLHVNQSQNLPAIEMPTGATTEQDHAAIYANVVNSGGAAEFIELNIFGPGSSLDGVQPAIVMAGAEHNGAVPANIQFQIPSGTDVFYAYSTGVHFSQPLYGTGGVLTIGDDVDLTGKTISIVGGNVDLSMGVPTNYPLNHISTTPNSAEFNAVVDCVNSAIGEMTNRQLFA